MHGFYAAREFAVHKSFNSDRGGLGFPPHLLLSSDHTHPRWRFSSHRRLKNILVLLEWVPGCGAPAAPAAAAARRRQPAEQASAVGGGEVDGLG